MQKTKAYILEELVAIFRDELDNETIHLAPETTSADVEEWDSLTQIQLTSVIQKRFDVKFALSEIVQWANVGDIVNSIHKHLAAQAVKTH